MVESISRSFLGKAQKDIDNKNKELDKRNEEVRKSINEFDKRLTKTLDVAIKASKSISDVKSKKQLEKAIQDVEDLEKIRSKLRKKGEKISSDEAKRIIESGQNLNQLLQGGGKITSEIEKKKTSLKEIDLETPLKRTSEKLGESVQEIFINNAENISKEGLTQDLGTVATRALSPELAFVTESLGLNFGGLFSSFSNEEEEIKTREALLKSQKDSTGEVVDAIENLSIAEQTSKEELIRADQSRNEENLVIANDRHMENLEALDNIEDGQKKNKGMFSKFFGKTGGLAKGALGAAGKFGKFAGKAGLIGAAGLTGFAIGSLINEHLISDDAKLAIGDFIGPKIDAIRDFFNDIPGNLKSFWESTLQVISDTGKSIQGFMEPILSSIGAFFEDPVTIISDKIKGIGDFFKEVFQEVDPEKIWTSIKETIFSPFKKIQEFAKNPISSIKEFFSSPEDPEGSPGFFKRIFSSFGDDESGSVGNLINDVGRASIDHTLNSSSELESGISQLQSAEILVKNMERQEQAQQKQNKDTLKILMEREEKQQKSSFSGKTSLDNSPIQSNDIGLVMVLGGG